MSTPVLRVQLDVIAQELTYMGSAKPIPETYWKDTLVPLLYPDWDSEKAVSYTHLTLPTSDLV